MTSPAATPVVSDAVFSSVRAGFGAIGSMVSVAVGSTNVPGVVALAVAVFEIVPPSSISVWETV